MKLNVDRWRAQVLCYTSCFVLLASLAFSATSKTNQIVNGERTKIAGSIVSRSGDLIQVHEKTSNDLIVVAITGTTKIERKKSHFPFFRHADMDVTAMVPGLTIDAEGVGNAKGQLEADKISFTPDAFAVEVAEEQQAIANSAAVQIAQSTASDGVAAAAQAQSLADQAKASAAEANTEAKAAATAASTSATAVSTVNQRVSILDDYTNEFEVDVFFARDEAILDNTAKRDLANLADIAKSLNGYMIEISGYSSNTLSRERDQQLSEERAAAVVQYFTEVKDIPMRRILVPIGYGRTHSVAPNTDAKGRELNRRVDIKVLVNKAIAPGL